MEDGLGNRSGPWSLRSSSHSSPGSSRDSACPRRSLRSWQASSWDLRSWDGSRWTTPSRSWGCWASPSCSSWPDLSSTSTHFAGCPCVSALRDLVSRWSWRSSARSCCGRSGYHHATPGRGGPELHLGRHHRSGPPGHGQPPFRGWCVRRRGRSSGRVRQHRPARAAVRHPGRLGHAGRRRPIGPRPRSCSSGTTVAALLWAIERATRWDRARQVAARLQDTSSQIGTRAAVVLVLGMAALAAHFGFEPILGTFLAGIFIGQLLKGRDREHVTRGRLEAVGFGFLVPVFFIASGMSLDIENLFTPAETAKSPSLRASCCWSEASRRSSIAGTCPVGAPRPSASCRPPTCPFSSSPWRSGSDSN